MRVAILEDEKPAADNLMHLLAGLKETVVIDQVIETVSQATTYFAAEPNINLAFFDIHLADGISFDIFEKVSVNVPVIFTTAYDEYALRAFKVNSIDYLLKPMALDELQAALNKFKSRSKAPNMSEDIKLLIKHFTKEEKAFKSSFLVHQRDLLIPLKVEDIAYITINAGLVKAIDFSNKSYILDEKLEDIEASLNPEQFFRANRQYIVQRRAITNITIYFNGKLILNIEPKPAERIIVSKMKAPMIKKWMN